MTDETQNEQFKDRRSASWEQHFATIANSVMVAGILFLGTQVWNTNTKLTEFAITNQYLANTVNELKIQIKDLNNSYVTKNEFRELESRVRKVENGK